MVSENAKKKFIGPSVLTKYPKFMVKASKLWMPQPPFYNTLLSLKLALRVILNDTNNVFSKGLYIEQNSPIFMLKASKLLTLRP